MLAGILIPITFFASVLGIFYFFYTTRNKERMSLIENDKDASIFFKSKKSTDVKRVKTNYTLKIGLLLIGLGVGVVLGNIVAQYSLLVVQTAYISMILIFGGLGLISYYLIEKKNKDKK
ncbi:MAG: hypothetical protein IMY72_11535 [Bacteroidetes bacterium]|nr:hypothetical protein [Bacteroidota bacterium]